MSRYGASPLHLLAHLALLPLAAWALLHVIDLGSAARVLLWLALSAVVHDLLLLPAYSVLDRVAERGLPGPAVNFVRVPAALSLLLGLVYLGEIGGHGNPAYRRASGLGYQEPLARWLLACAALFAIAGAVYLLRGRSRSAGSTT